MPKFFCTLCGNKWTTDIHDVWSCNNCEMGVAEYHIEDYDPSELKQLLAIFENAKKDILNRGIHTKGSVFPVFIHEAELTESLLDLSVMFFDHILLYVDTFNIRKKKQRIIDKLNAYIEKGYISIFNWSDEIFTGISCTRPHIPMDHIAKTKQAFLHTYIQKFAEIQTYIDLSFIQYDLLREALRKTPFWKNLRNNNSRVNMMLYLDAHRHFFNRLNGFTMLCDILDCNILTDSFITEFKKLKYKADFDELAKTKNIILNLIEWYSDKITEFPKFEKPETLIDYRNEIEKDNFINYIVNQYNRISKSTHIPNDVIMEGLKNKIDENLEKAKRICGKTYKTKQIILSGLIASLGGLVRGSAGAFIGGIASSLAILGAEYFDRKTIEHWASFFIE